MDNKWNEKMGYEYNPEVDLLKLTGDYALQQAELATLRRKMDRVIIERNHAEVERNNLRAENERLRERLLAAEYVLKQARPESGYWDTYAKESLK